MAFSSVTSLAYLKPPTPPLPPAPTWNTFGPNTVRTSFRPILLIEEVWPDLTPVLGWYPAPLLPVIRIWPIQPLESTLVLMRYYHRPPPIKWKADDMLDLYQDVEQSDPSGRATLQQGALDQ